MLPVPPRCYGHFRLNSSRANGRVKIQNRINVIFNLVAAFTAQCHLPEVSHEKDSEEFKFYLMILSITKAKVLFIIYFMT